MLRWILAWIMIAAPAVMALAEPQEIRAKPGKPWTHKASNFVFPASVGIYTRRALRDYGGGKRMDIGANYEDPMSSALISMFVYRPAMSSGPLWFDVAAWYLQRQNAWGQAHPVSEPQPFAMGPRPGKVALRQSFAVGGVGQSTTVAVIPYGPWLIKLRMTSRTLQPKAIGPALQEFLDQIQWPVAIGDVNDATPMQKCTTALDARKADEIVQTSALILAGATQDILWAEEEKGRKDNPLRFCHDAGSDLDSVPVYQLDEGASGYVIALGDNGTVLSVRPDRIGAQIAHEIKGGSGADAPPLYRVTLIAPDRFEQFAAFSSLPRPAQAIELIDSRAPFSTTTTLGKRTISLDRSSFR